MVVLEAGLTKPYKELTQISNCLKTGAEQTQDTYTECPRRNVPDFGRVFLMLKYTDTTQNTYVQS